MAQMIPWAGYAGYEKTILGDAGRHRKGAAFTVRVGLTAFSLCAHVEP